MAQATLGFGLGGVEQEDLEACLVLDEVVFEHQRLF
jgi:hypothetical protein